MGGSESLKGLVYKSAKAGDGRYEVEKLENMIAGMYVGMNVLSGFQTPERGAGVVAFGQNNLAGFFVVVTDLGAVVERFNVHNILHSH